MKITRILTDFGDFYISMNDPWTPIGKLGVCKQAVQHILGCNPAFIKVSATTIRPGKRGWKIIDNLIYAKYVTISGIQTDFITHSQLSGFIAEHKLPSRLWIKMEAVFDCVCHPQ